MTKRSRPPLDEIPFLEPAAWPFLLTLDEVAAILGCCARTVRRSIARGKLRAVRTGGLHRVRRPDLQVLLDPDKSGWRQRARRT